MKRAAASILLLVSSATAACGGGSGKKTATCPAGQHDGGDGVCVALAACSSGYHDGGGGLCLPDLACATGYHDGGGGVCVPNGTCSAGYHDGGGGKCAVLGACATGYRLASDGTCVRSATCATGTHDNGAGVCVADVACPAGFHDGGSGTCVPAGSCSANYHDGGGGACVLAGTCVAGYHDGGAGTCVPLVACSASYHDGGDGTCVRDGLCSPGYRDGGDGRCVTLGSCSTGYHEGGDGTCWPASQCARSYVLDGSGQCVYQPTAGTGGATSVDAGPAGGGRGGAGGIVGPGGPGGAGVGGAGVGGRVGAGGTTAVTFTLPPIPAVCGNLKQESGEGCDDGNTLGQDGCSADCRVEEGHACPVPGQPCIDVLGCGNGVLTADETCDDGNTTSGDGCSADCAVLEDGWVCRVPGGRCTPTCGDKKKIADEQCDDGNTKSGDGCSSTCQVEPGYDCPTLGQACVGTVCGNGKREVGEACDCGGDPTNLPSGCKAVNGLFYGDPRNPGCSRTCTVEPKCLDSSGKTQACSSSCGDDNVDPGEECDDGNANSGDGCSDKCKLEAGFKCTTSTVLASETCQSSSGQCLRLPVIYRDFKPQNESGGHPDFYWLSKTEWCVPNSSGPAQGNDSTSRCWGIAADALLNGKPQPGSTKSCACRFSDWSVGNSADHIGGNYARSDSPLDGRTDLESYTSNGGGIWSGTMPAFKDANSFKQWYSDDASINKTFYDVLELPAIGSNVYQYASKVRRLDGGFFPLDALNAEQRTLCNLWPYWSTKFFPSCRGDQYLFPPRVQSSDCPAGDDYRDGCWLTGLSGVKHDSYFTDEVRHYFTYDKDAGLALQFFGDDDLFVFINGKLVLDLGGIHQQLPGKVIVTGSVGVATIVEGGCLDTAGNIIGATAGSSACSPTNSTPPTASSPDDFRSRKVELGLEHGRVYELLVLGADRHPPESNYQLTLQGFTNKRSSCIPRCGDGLVTVNEECDCGDGSVDVVAGCPGRNDDKLYGGCTTTCHFGPYCGDGHVDGPEECDLGRDNGDPSLGKDGCSVGCLRPRFCGDGIVDAKAGEACDLGDGNGLPQASCDRDCQRVVPQP